MFTDNVNRVTGLSGIDTESMIEKLMKAESTKYTNIQKKKQWTMWQQDAFRSKIKSIQNFQNTYFKSMDSSTGLRYKSAFQNYKMKALLNGVESDAIKLNSATSSGNYEVNVIQTALNDKWTASSKATRNLESDVSINDMAAAIDKLGPSDVMKISVTLDGVTKNLEFKKSDISSSTDTTGVINAFNSQLQSAFGYEVGTSGSSVTDQKVYVDNSGGKLKFKTNTDGHKVSIADGGGEFKDSSLSFDMLSSLLDSDGKLTNDLSGSFKLKTKSGDTYTINVNLKKDDTVSDISNKISSALSSVQKDGETDPNKKANLLGYLGVSIAEKNGKKVISLNSKNANEDFTVEDTNFFSQLKGSTVGNTTLRHTGSLTDFGFKSGETNKLNMSESVKDALGITSSITISINNNNITIDPTDSVSKVLGKINVKETGVNMSFNTVTEKFSIESSDSGAVNQINFGTDADTQTFLSALGIDTSSPTADTYTAGRDAIISVDGVQTTRSSNEIDIDGLKMTITKEAEGKTFQVTAENDVDATYDKIKKFVDDYNSLISDLNKGVKETRARNGKYSYYEPLSDEEKKALGDSEIEKYEEKAKTGLLYNDSSLKSLLSNMRSTLYESFNLANGEKIALYDIGITTSNDYTENGKLVIDEAKLKEALRTRGDDIAEMFTKVDGISAKLNDSLDKAVGFNGSLRYKAGIEGTSSVNENVLSWQIKDYDEQLDKLQEYLYNKEMKYYEMFANMESAINKQNNQMSSLLSMSGS